MSGQVYTNKVEVTDNYSYVFIKSLDPGGTYGETWEATAINKFTRERQTVAIKVYKVRRTDIAMRNQMQQELLNETQSLKWISSVCRDTSVCYIDSYLYPLVNGYPRLVMSLINGKTVNKVIGTKTLRQRYDNHNIIRDLIIGLDNFHFLGITHQDIKESNLMFDEDSGKYKFIDWGGGCINSIKCRNNPDYCEKPCGYVGTPYTTPPEYNNSRVYNAGNFNDTRAHDIWSIGVVLFDWYTMGNSNPDAVIEWSLNNGINFIKYDKKLNELTQEQINQLIIENIANQNLRNLIYNLLTVDKNVRLSNWETVFNTVITLLGAGDQAPLRYQDIPAPPEPIPIIPPPPVAVPEYVPPLEAPRLFEEPTPRLFEEPAPRREPVIPRETDPARIRIEKLRELGRKYPHKTPQELRDMLMGMVEVKPPPPERLPSSRIQSLINRMLQPSPIPERRRNAADAAGASSERSDRMVISRNPLTRSADRMLVERSKNRCVPDYNSSREPVLTFKDNEQLYCLTVEEVLNLGIFKPENNSFINPYTGNTIIINPDTENGSVFLRKIYEG
jgi:serine/threonine protein kinase